METIAAISTAMGNGRNWNYTYEWKRNVQNIKENI